MNHDVHKKNQKKSYLYQILLLLTLVCLIIVALVVNSNKRLKNSSAQTITSTAGNFEAESTSYGSPVTLASDSQASNGQYIQFGSSAATVAPTPTGVTTLQPTAPYIATFYYMWFKNPAVDGGTSWGTWGDGHQPPSNWFSNYIPHTPRFDPNNFANTKAYGLYSSNEDNVIYWQLQNMKNAHIEVAIASWWGQNSREDIAFRHIITDIMNRPDNPYPNLRWAIYYEQEGFGDPTVTQLDSDLNYIKNNYANQKAFLKINNKPVAFVYNAAHTGYSPLNDLSRWKTARADTGFYVNMKIDPLNAGANPADMDGWHQYAPASYNGSMSNYYYFISPGFWRSGDPVRLGRNLSTFQQSVSNMKNANVTWKLIETWNEWGEGTGVEPAYQVNQVTSGNATLTSPLGPNADYLNAIVNANL